MPKKPLMLELGRDYINHYTDLMSEFIYILKHDLSADLSELSKKDRVNYKRTIRRLKILNKICSELTRVERVHPPAYFWKGVVYAKLGQTEKANENLNKAKEMSKILKARIEKELKKRNESIQCEDTNRNSKIRNIFTMVIQKIRSYICRPFQRSRQST